MRLRAVASVAICLFLLGSGTASAARPNTPPRILSPHLYSLGDRVIRTDGTRFAASEGPDGSVTVDDTRLGARQIVASTTTCAAGLTPDWAIGGGQLMFACNPTAQSSGTLCGVQAAPPTLFDLTSRSDHGPALSTAPPPPCIEVAYFDVGRYWLAYSGSNNHGGAYEAFLNWRTGDVSRNGDGKLFVADLSYRRLQRPLCAPFSRKLVDEPGDASGVEPFSYDPPYGAKALNSAQGELLRCGRASPVLICDFCTIDVSGGVAVWSDQVIADNGREHGEVWAMILRSHRRFRWRFSPNRPPQLAHTANRVYIRLNKSAQTLTARLR